MIQVVNIIWHIVRKDFRRCRWALWLLAGVWLVKSVLLFTLLIQNDPRPSVWDYYTDALNGTEVIGWVIAYCHNFVGEFSDFSIFWWVCGYADFFLLVGIILCLMKEDSTLDEKSFWRTRPISNWQMFTAKALFIGLIVWPAPVALQILVNVLAPSFAGTDPSWLPHWRDEVPDVILIQTVWVAPAILVGSLWRNRVIGVCVFTLVFALMIAAGAALNLANDPGVGRFGWIAFTLLAGSVLIAFAMYQRPNRAFGFSLFGLLVAIIFTLLFLP